MPSSKNKNPKRVEAGKRNRRLRKQITSEGRRKLREQALQRQPWVKSTGPRSAEGKATASANATKPLTAASYTYKLVAALRRNGLHQ